MVRSIIEVGHRIGHAHETCPGPGRPAPAMTRRIDGLHRRVANAWPGLTTPTATTWAAPTSRNGCGRACCRNVKTPAGHEGPAGVDVRGNHMTVWVSTGEVEVVKLALPL
jgi:hypothetical protein